MLVLCESQRLFLRYFCAKIVLKIKWHYSDDFLYSYKLNQFGVERLA